MIFRIKHIRSLEKNLILLYTFCYARHARFPSSSFLLLTIFLLTFRASCPCCFISILPLKKIK